MSAASLSPPPFPPDYRASGLLLHVTSLPSPYGIGDVGPTALSWIDRLAQAGQSWWQMLPLGPTGYGNSPYQSLSSFAGNGLLISPDWLIEDELLRASDCEAYSFPQERVDYNAVIPFKQGLCEKAWTNFSAGARADLRPAYEQFRKHQEQWLEDYALFRALKVKFGGAHYLEWPAELVQRQTEALGRARRELTDQMDQVCFVQFLLFRQGERLKTYAHSKGLSLSAICLFLFRPTRATSGLTRSCFYWTSSAGRASSLVCLPITSARKDSFGAILSITGRLFDNQIISGPSLGCELCWPTLT